MTVYFSLSFPKKNAHIITVRMKFHSPFNNPIIELPSWTPGSYLIREYARHVLKFCVKDQNGEVEWKKVTKNNWQIFATKGDEIEVSYEVYAFEMTVRTNYLDNYLGLINGTATFFYVCDPVSKNPVKEVPVKVDLDAGNFMVITSLVQEGERYIASDYDELYDSPIGLAVEGYLEMREYLVENIPCKLSIIGKRGNHDAEQLVKDLTKIQEASIKLFGELPYDRYVWLLYIRESGGGGLEHKYSNVSIAPRWNFRKQESYLNVLRLESHEHFHVYNVKRIRPKVFGPFDYSMEVYTTSLWIAEGLTNYYEKKIMLYAGLYSLDDFFREVEKAINDYFSIPGRFETSVAESSFDAWIKLYRPNENTPNSVISYYLKGGLVGLLLDIEIREQTDWKKSLDDVFRGLYQLYKENPAWGYSDDEFPALVERFTGAKIDEFYEKFVIGVEELPFSEFLPKIGVQINREMVPCKSLFGVKFSGETGKIRSILSTSPALEAGISPGDELISVGGFRFSNKTIEEIIQSTPEGIFLDIVFIHDGVEIRSKIRNVKKEAKWTLVLPGSEEIRLKILSQFSKIRND